MTRAVAVTLALALAWGLGAGCASSAQQVSAHDWQHFEPAGGWTRYAQTHYPYEPRPMESAAGIQPRTSPLLMLGTSTALR